MTNASRKSVLLEPDDSVLLLIDHQSGLLQTVKDIGAAELRANTAVLARVATLMNVPIITTASVPEGPNGPLLPEIARYASHAVFVPRKGEVNAWDNEDFVKTVRATGKRTLIMAGIWTSVCVAFPAISAKVEGYEVYGVLDASGDPSFIASRATVARLTQAGVIPVSTNAVVAELQKTWNRPEAMAFAELYAEMVPDYRAVIESHRSAQDAMDQDAHPSR